MLWSANTLDCAPFRIYKYCTFSLWKFGRCENAVALRHTSLFVNLGHERRWIEVLRRYHVDEVVGGVEVVRATETEGFECAQDIGALSIVEDLAVAERHQSV